MNMTPTADFRDNLYIPDVKEILLVLWRRRALIITIVAAVTLLGLCGILLKSNSYKAVSDLLIEDQNLNLTDFSDVNASAKFDDRTVTTEVNVLMSPSLALQTIRATGLNKTKEFQGDRPEDSVPAFLSSLDVKPQSTSRVIEVSFTSKDPELAAKVANAHVNSYMQFKIATKKKRVADMSVQFQDKVQDLKNDVMKKAQAAEAYRAQNGIVSGRTDQDLVNEQISNISDKIAPIEVHKFDVEARLKSIEAAEQSGHPDAIPDIVNSPLIQNLKQQRGVISQQTGTGMLGPRHPKRLMAGGEAGQINAQINKEIVNIKESLKNDLAATNAQEEMLKGRLQELQNTSSGQREKMIALNSLNMEKDASQKLLDSFLANYENIQSQVSFARSDATQISPAIVPTKPSGLSKKMLLAAIIAFAGFLSLAVVFVQEVMQGGVRNFEDLQRMGHNTLGIVPVAEAGNIVSLATNNSSYREAIKRIYMSALMNSGAKTVLVTSALPEEGRTHIVTALSSYLVSLNHKVVVIDADFHRPSFSASAGGAGLVDVLTGAASLDQALAREPSGLVKLSAGRNAAALPDSLRSEKFSQLLNELKNRYDYVLIDSGPLLAHSEASVISGHADGIIVVVEWLKTSRKNISSTLARLAKGRVPVLGVVINKVDIDKYKNSNSGSDFLLPNVGKV